MLARTSLRAACRSGVMAPLGMQVRNLNVHEYVGMELFKQYGVRVPKGGVADTPEGAEHIYRDSGCVDMVMKAQVLAGGRGLGKFTNGFQGGVHFITEAGQAEEYASKMLNQVLVTKQTGAEGKPCNKVFLAERVYARRELYFSILMDRSHGGPVIVASTAGGTSIEDVAAQTPEKIITRPIDIMEGPTAELLEGVADGLGFKGDLKAEAVDYFGKVYQMFDELDATMLEINPLVETPDSKLYICDAKLNFDPNTEFRQHAVFARRDTTQEDAREVEAAKYDLNYIGLDGNIGCMVNGAGLAMATMDIIQLHGGKPANFLDVGGGATGDQVQKAFEILNSDANVKAILVNIFGGIMRCDVIAKGILGAAKHINLTKPIVIRLQGTNVDIAEAMIEGSGFRMIVAKDLDDAATKAARIADIVKAAEEIQVGVSFELPL